MQSNYKETVAYKAGKIIGYMHNAYSKRDDLPSVAHCMHNFMHLKTILGKYYSLLKNNKNINPSIIEYENFINQMDLTEINIGTFEMFMVGFAYSIKKKNL